MDLTSVINQMVVLLVCIVVGIIASRTGVMTKTGNKYISDLVINITCPALILSSAISGDPPRLAPELMVELLLLSVGCYIALPLLAWILPKLLRVPGPYVGMFRFGTVFSNVKFMGFPVVAALLGQEGLLYAAVFNITFDLLVFTLGVWYMSGGKDGAKVTWKMLASPSIIAAVLALVISATGLRFPAAVGQCLQVIGNITTPASMLVVGASIGALSLRAMVSDWKLDVLLLARQFLLPTLGFFILRPILSGPVVLAMAMLMLAMPIASITTMFCLQYDLDEVQGSRAVFLSTLISIASIPILTWVLPI